MFRTKRSKVKARARGQILALQWIDRMHAKAQRAANNAAHQEAMTQLIQRADELMPHWTPEQRRKWLNSWIGSTL